jgi:hypothetical protein
MPAIRDAFCPECRGDLDAAPANATAAFPPGDQATRAAADNSVWYASEGRVFRWFKQSWYDDRGSLQPTSEGIRFVGENGAWTLGQPSAVQLIGPVIPWIAFVSLAIGNGLVLLMSWAGLFNFLTLNSPETYIFLGIMDLLAPACWPMKWVKVDYLDEQGRPTKAYFTAASVLERWRGGVKRLLAQIQQADRSV